METKSYSSILIQSGWWCLALFIHISCILPSGVSHLYLSLGPLPFPLWDSLIFFLVSSEIGGLFFCRFTDFLPSLI